MRRDPEFFPSDTELELLYMARRLSDALKLEELLTAVGIEYLVETGTFTGGLLIRRNLTGAFFYVPPEEIGRARDLLLRNRYKPYQVETTG